MFTVTRLWAGTKIPFVYDHTWKLLSSVMHFRHLGGIVRYVKRDILMLGTQKGLLNTSIREIEFVPHENGFHI